MATYFGGKNHLYRSIINLIPRHERFVEAFAGSAAVARHLARNGAEGIVVELDPAQVRWLKARPELEGHRIVGGDAFEVLMRYRDEWGPETVVFVDPPYPIEDRRDARPRYRCELDARDHERLISILRTLRCRVIVCGHPWGTYARRLADWRRHEFRTGLRSGRAGIECVWTNFDDAYPLHDYRYFGADKQHRQDLRRRVERQLALFRAMDKHHRAAILGELAAAFPLELLGQARTPAPPAPRRKAPTPTRTSRGPRRRANLPDPVVRGPQLDLELRGPGRRRRLSSRRVPQNAAGPVSRGYPTSRAPMR